MALPCLSPLQFKTKDLFGFVSNPSRSLPGHTKLQVHFVGTICTFNSKSKCTTSIWGHFSGLSMKPFIVEAKANTRTDSAKIRNRRRQKKFNGTATKPRLSVFCSDKQLYATLVDDENKKCLFYGSTLQRSIRGDPPCTKIEAAERVGNEIVKTCITLEINEISSYDRNGFARGERMAAFEVAISQHGFLLR